MVEATRICPFCGTANNPEARFCKGCGEERPTSQIERGTIQCPRCQAEVGSTARYCKYCGHQMGEEIESEHVPSCAECGSALHPGAKFCKDCGARVDGTEVGAVAGATPFPEVDRRMSVGGSVILPPVCPPAGSVTVIGLDLGNTNTYLAHARMAGGELISQPELLQVEGSSRIDSAVFSSISGRDRIGASAVSEMEKHPHQVRSRLLDQLVTGGAEGTQTIKRFLIALSDQVRDVLGSEALDPNFGGRVALAVDPEVDTYAERCQRLSELLETTGFPVWRLTPGALAAYRYHVRQGAILPASEKGLFALVDWGGSALRISIVENQDDPLCIEHCSFPEGGIQFDALFADMIRARLPGTLNQDDQLQLKMFARRFKERLSEAFSAGRNEYSEYCLLPVGSTPTKISVSKPEIEDLTLELRERFRERFEQVLHAIGVETDHLGRTILYGGGANWFFIREDMRRSLGLVPLVAPRPQVTAAMGLIV